MLTSKESVIMHINSFGLMQSWGSGSGSVLIFIGWIRGGGGGGGVIFFTIFRA
jgi:hypothetical protein